MKCWVLVTFGLILCINWVQAFHHKLTKRELVQTFGVEKVEHVPEYHLIRAERKSLPNNRTQLSFKAWNDNYVLDLELNKKLISPYLKSIIRNNNHTETINGLPNQLSADCHYIGQVISRGHPVAISDCRKLMGVIVTDQHFLMIQTLPERLHNEEEEKHVVYKRESGLINPLEHLTTNIYGDSIHVEVGNQNVNENQTDEFCDVSASKPNDYVSSAFLLDNLLEVNYTIPPEAKLDSLFIFPQLDPITLEIALFLDSELFEHFKREFTSEPVEHLTEFSLALINNVHVLYQQPTLSPNLDVVIVHFELWKTQPAPLATHLHKNGQAQTLLDSFCRHQARINPGSDLTDPSHWDHGILLTGYDIYHTTPSVAGVAPVARMCDELFACSLVEGLHLGRSFVLAHELGHNMGMVHDGVQNDCGRSCCLMSAVNGAGKTTWSQCSVREFNAFMVQLDQSGRGNCLRDPPVAIASHDHLRDGRLPGQRFTANQQCSYFWGRDYQIEIPNGRSFDDICRILWCGNAGSTISTAHPALEGSWCGDKKWCQEGKCEVWRQNTPLPEVVNGGWSAWTSGDKNCPVNQCQITGSIPINSQLRTCTHPAPNNGGKQCKGASLRGLICSETAKSDCNGLTRKEYGDRLCTSIRNDPIRPDRQLSGTSFLHITQPCKVWCHVSGSELIRNKGQFPNGSPCADNHYCVGGNCLALNCKDRAIVANSEDCPEIDLNLPKKESMFDEWSKWTECSVSCGSTGIQKRWRKCIGKETQCEGKSSENRECSPAPPACERYSEWQEWEKCSAKKCGEVGRKVRKRVCLSGEGTCHGRLGQEEPCTDKTVCAQWKEWESWSECQKSASDAQTQGQKTRKRECSTTEGQCEGEAREIVACKVEETTQKEWSHWTECSSTCGIGFQLRERLCGDKKCGGKQAKTCNVQECNKPKKSGTLSDWSSWSSCSKSCGQGIEVRRRTCSDSQCDPDELLSEERRCVLQLCPLGIDSLFPILPFVPVDVSLSEWSSWEEWGTCFSPKSCGSGYRQRFRMCREGFDCSTKGPSFEIQPCTNTPCPDEIQLDRRKRQWSSWTSWSICESGKMHRTRSCNSPLVFLCDGYSKEERNCNEGLNELESVSKLPQWSEWSNWSSCSCFTLKSFRRRFCTIVDPSVQGFCVGALIDQRSCEPQSCASINGDWSSWSVWSECSNNCGSGYQIRNRMCSEPLPSNRGSYCVGYSFDQRGCIGSKICTGKAVDGNWSQWTSWTECNTGQRSRTRYCTQPQPKNGGKSCSGNDFELQPCTEHFIGSNSTKSNFNSWSEWSNCTSDCGVSFKSRQRYCNSTEGGCKGLAYMTSICRGPPCKNTHQTQPSHWQRWQPWTQQNTCHNCTRTRVRNCIMNGGGLPCFGKSTQLEPCNEKSQKLNDQSTALCSQFERTVNLVENDLKLIY